jgi:hypothetical protein
MLMKLVGLKRYGEMGEWRGLHNHLCCILLIKYNLGDKIKKNKMGMACGIYGGQERCILGFGGDT